MKKLFPILIFISLTTVAFRIYKYSQAPSGPNASPTPTNTLSPQPSGTPLPTPITEIPKDKISCEKIHGIWYPNTCIMPTTDKDQICTDGSQCQGKVCLIDPTPEQKETISKSPDGLIPATGQCTEWMLTLGCQFRVQNGKAGYKVCVD